MDMKNKTGVIFIVCLLGAVIIFLAQQMVAWRAVVQANENYYTKAITALEQQHYQEALNSLDHIQSEEPYEDEETLRSYIAMQLARQEAAQRGGTIVNPLDDAYKYALKISVDYTGVLADEILQQRELTREEYNQAEVRRLQREAEVEKWLEEQRLAEQKEFLAQLAQTIPYKGMGEEYIGMTLLGPADECENRDETDSRGTHYSREYSWYADDGKLACWVWCINKQVHMVSKYGTDIYWTADGKPDFGNTTRRKEPKKSSNSNKRNDPYHASEYGYADDFYEDYYDEFYDFEDAEDYWEAHGGGED